MLLDFIHGWLNSHQLGAPSWIFNERTEETSENVMLDGLWVGIWTTDHQNTKQPFIHNNRSFILHKASGVIESHGKQITIWATRHSATGWLDGLWVGIWTTDYQNTKQPFIHNNRSFILHKASGVIESHGKQMTIWATRHTATGWQQSDRWNQPLGSCRCLTGGHNAWMVGEVMSLFRLTHDYDIRPIIWLIHFQYIEQILNHRS